MNKKIALLVAVCFMFLAGYAYTADVAAEKKSDSGKGKTEIIISEKEMREPSPSWGYGFHEPIDSMTCPDNDRSMNMFAQAPPSGSSEFRGFPFSPGSDDGPSFKTRLVIMYRLVEHLDLNEETATKFFPLFLTYNNERDKIMKEHRDLIRAIADGANDTSVSVKELKSKVEEMRAKERKLDSQRNDFFAKAEKILNERQFIKLIVFNDKLKEDLIMQFRAGRMEDDTRRSTDVQLKTKDEVKTQR